MEEIKEEKLEKCPECGSEDLDINREESFCRKCGLVFED